MADVRSVTDGYPRGGVHLSNGFLRNARPPTEMVQAGRRAVQTFAELRVLRASLRRALAGQPMPDGGALDPVPETMAIIVTELAANAMVHARPPTTVRLFVWAQIAMPTPHRT